MDKIGTKAYMRKLLRDFFVFHWVGQVDELRYMGFMEGLKTYIEENDWPEKVILCLNSEGGDLDVAWSFYDYVRFSGLHLVTVASGDVASAAVLLFLSGKERYASRFSSFLIHNPALEVHHVELSESNIEQTRLHVLSMHERYLKVFAKTSGLSQKDVAQLSKKAMPLSVERAKSLGIVHRIV